MINRRRVLQACQATGADASVHIQIANTLPAICSSIVDGDSYRIEPTAIRRAMDRHLNKGNRTDAYASGVEKALGWLQQNGHLPEPSSYAAPTVKLDDNVKRQASTGEAVPESEPEAEPESEPEAEPESEPKADDAEEAPEPAPKARKRRSPKS